eukprot:Opistho-1_new@11302
MPSPITRLPDDNARHPPNPANTPILVTLCPAWTWAAGCRFNPAKPLSVLENIRLAPAQAVQGRTGRQEGEAGLRQSAAAFAVQDGVQLVLELVQVEHVGSGVFELFRQQVLGAPIGGLLLLRQIDAEQFLAQILEPMPVGEGAHQLGGDLGAVDRRAVDIQGDLQRSQIKAGEVEQLQDLGIFQQRLQVRRLHLAAGRRLGDLHQMADAVALAHLHQAQPVARRVEAHGLGIDRDHRAQFQIGRQVAAIEFNAHPKSLEATPNRGKTARSATDSAILILFGGFGKIRPDFAPGASGPGAGRQAKRSRRMVPRRRLELPRVAPQRPQRCASTNSATTASPASPAPCTLR